MKATLHEIEKISIHMNYLPDRIWNTFEAMEATKDPAFTEAATMLREAIRLISRAGNEVHRILTETEIRETEIRESL